jgi:lipid-binding SYLF domain-containing protein
MNATFLKNILITLAVALPLALPSSAIAASKAELNASSKAALDNLVATVPAAAALKSKALAVLVFPSITKAGLIIGGQYGEGVLWQGGKPVGYYNTGGASYGLQAGAQTYGYAMFFMTKSALNSLGASDGFEIGVGPSVVVVDQGMGKNLTTKTMSDDVYAIVFGQQGLMAGVGIQGNKISKLNK